jgi:hypothetical protein
VAGRFPLYTDNDVLGALVKALRRAGWDVARGVDILPEDALDPEHFEKAAELGRALVTNDQPLVYNAHRWIEEGRRFKGIITWPKAHYKRMSIGDLVREFEELAAKKQPFDPDYPIVRIKPQNPRS